MNIARPLTTAIALLLLASFAAAQPKTRQAESYPQHPDALLKDGVPVGTITKGVFNASQIYPGTVRDYWVYVPKQYDGSKPAALMVFQDGGGYARREGGYRIPNIFDNLIAAGEMPVTIAVFINPGVVPALNDNAQSRFNRSYEYDSVDDSYANFLIDEMLPFVEKEHNVQLTDDPNLRAICGSSSGGICAYNVAWQRPDHFRRVFTTVGTYVGLRGGHELATLVRKTEPKPLRIYLQDGSNDLNIYAGDWWMANQTLLRALQWAGYEVEHTWGEGFHSSKHGTAIMPDVMRWLWKDFDTQPVSTHLDRSNSEANKFLVDGEGWELVSEGHKWAEGLAVTDDGTLYFTDVPASELYMVTPDGEVSLIVSDTGKTNGISLGPDGRLYGAASGARQIRAWDLKTLEMEVIAEGTTSNDIVVRHDGTIYYTDPPAGKIWSLDAKTRERKAVDNFKDCNGIGLSADQTQLFVGHFPGRFINAFQIADDGSLKYKQPYFHLEIPAADPRGLLDGMCVSQDGWLISTTAMGVQICDQPGRSHLILPMPPGSRRPSYVAFGGPDRKTLYVANVDKIYRRKTQLVGADNWKQPVKPPKPRL
ncbi:SMP-30/gluconolactonase/LRE family protein [Rosistilla oblonga]|uniref:SMP-30/gluconolactonase/LRE family protein n=1 Tax=Rosistilla oblonga TaxID=2527990 RepID=UPI003A982654